MRGTTATRSGATSVSRRSEASWRSVNGCDEDFRRQVWIQRGVGVALASMFRMQNCSEPMESGAATITSDFSGGIHLDLEGPRNHQVTLQRRQIADEDSSDVGFDIAVCQMGNHFLGEHGDEPLVGRVRALLLVLEAFVERRARDLRSGDHFLHAGSCVPVRGHELGERDHQTLAIDIEYRLAVESVRSTGQLRWNGEKDSVGDGGNVLGVVQLLADRTIS